MPTWVKTLLDDWVQSACLTTGRLFRRVNKNAKAWGDGLTEKAVWHIVKQSARSVGVAKLAPYDLRRTLGVHARYPPAAAVHVAHQVARVFDRRLNFDPHHRL